MYLGPIHSTLPGIGTGHNPVKQIHVVSNVGRQAVLFDQDYAFATQPSANVIDADTFILEGSQAAAIARIHQIKELFQNSDWHRAGLAIQWREDGVVDPADGWYFPEHTMVTDDLVFSAYGEYKLSVAQRATLKTQVGIYVDAKAVANDANLTGTTLAAYHAGMATPFPIQSYTLVGSNGNILVVENPSAVLRANLTSLTLQQTVARCKVADDTVNHATSTEVFWKDHRNINGYWAVSNDLLRYTIQENASGSPLLEYWDGGSASWKVAGNFQLQTTNAGPILPLQSVTFQTISPEEVIWTERRFDSAGSGMVSVQMRMRRGSRLLEYAILAASGAGLTGTQSIGLVSAQAGVWTAATSADSTGVAFTNATAVVGFCFLTGAPNAASVSSQSLFAGATVPAGTVTRGAIFAGYQDAQYATFAPPTTPGAPTVSTVGAAGATSYTYAYKNVGASDSAQGATTTIATSNATLNGTNFNRLTLPALPAGVTSRKIFRTASAGTPATTGFIGSTSGTTFDDTGLAVQTDVVISQVMAFISRWASYNRNRVRQRLLVG